MTGGVVDGLGGALAPAGRTHEACGNGAAETTAAGAVAGATGAAHGTSDGITDGIGEVCKAGGLIGVALGGHGVPLFGHFGCHTPALTVENHVGMGFVNCLHHRIDGFRIDQTHQIKAEAVDVIFIRPVGDGVYDVLLYHSALAGGVISTAGAGRVASGGSDAAKIAGDDLVEAERLCIVHMVVHHVHDDADSIVMKTFYHLLKFRNTDLTIVGVCGVGAFGDVVVLRVIAPVEVVFLEIGFVNGAVVIAGQQMDVGNTQIFHIVQTGRYTLGIGGAGFDKTQEFSLVLNAGAFIHTQVTDVKLINHGISNVVSIVGILVRIPTFGVSGIQINDHGSLTVDTGGSGIWVASLHALALHVHLIGVVHTVQIAGLFQNPGAVYIRGHLQLFHQVRGSGIAAFVKVDLYCLGCGCPHTEDGAFLGPGKA